MADSTDDVDWHDGAEDFDAWMIELADLIDAILNCQSADETHDLIVNYAAELSDGADRLRG